MADSHIVVNSNHIQNVFTTEKNRFKNQSDCNAIFLILHKDQLFKIFQKIFAQIRKTELGISYLQF